MSTPQGILAGQSVTRPPDFNGQDYSWWKNRMENYIQADDCELCDALLSPKRENYK